MEDEAQTLPSTQYPPEVGSTPIGYPICLLKLTILDTCLLPNSRMQIL